MTLTGKVALVTGGSRGVGRGIARALGEAGATVYVTGRTSKSGQVAEPGTIEHAASEVDALGGRGIPVRCDHGVDGEIESLFARIAAESGRLDLLVNNVHSGLETIAKKVGDRFWVNEPDVWDRMNHVGLRGHYLASVHAARLMVPKRSGLIVNISSFGAVTYLFNIPYGVGKAALDRMTRDFAVELRKEGVGVVSVWPGLVRTELTASLMEEATPGYRRIFDAYAESPLVAGRAVAHLAAHPDRVPRDGGVVIAADIVRKAGLRGENGERVESPRSIRLFAKAALPGRWRALAAVVPPWSAPFWLARLVLKRFTEILKENGGYSGRR